MAALVSGGAGRRERLELESHARRCGRCATALNDLAAASIALDRAYAPLRATTVAISPARVRLALLVPEPTPLGLRVTRVTARLTEVALAAAVTAFAFVGSASVSPKPAIVDETAVETVAPARVSTGVNDESFIRWLRIGRYGASADLAALSLPSHHDEDEIAPSHERSGLAR